MVAKFYYKVNTDIEINELVVDKLGSKIKESKLNRYLQICRMCIWKLVS